MGTIRSGLLEKAGFGQFQKENQDALAMLQQEKQNLRVKRKLGEAQERANQVRIKFKEPPYGEYSEEGIPNLREAMIKIGNQVNPIRATFRYQQPEVKNSFLKPAINVHGVFSTREVSQEGVPWYGRRYGDAQNKIFKPSQLQQVLAAVKKRYPAALQVFGERISGIRSKLSNQSGGVQEINLEKLGKKTGKKTGKRVGLLGLGLSLAEAMKAGKDAYDAKEGDL